MAQLLPLVSWIASAALASAALAAPGLAQQPAARTVPDSVSALFAYPRADPPRYETRATTQMDGFELRDIRYTSPRGGTVTAFLLVPVGTGPFPAVVYGHWGNGTRSAFLPEAMMLARAGVASLIADAPFARSLDSYKPADGPQAREVYIQAVVDTRYGLDILEREPAVDRARIGYAGLSFGAQVGAILGGIDPRIKAFVLMGGLPSLARGLEFGESPQVVRMREGIQDKEGFKRFLASLSEIDSERFTTGAHAPLLFQFGRYDAAIPAADARRFGEQASEPKDVRWYAVGHEFNDIESLNDRAAWLGKHLRFDAPAVVVRARGTAVAQATPRAGSVVSPDGTRIAYDVSGSGPAIILLHGGGQSRKVWHSAGYVSRLAGDFTVITMDLRGHGGSERPPDAGAYAIERLTDDILAVADAAGARHFSLWGFSYGANIGRYVAARGDRVTSMVYIGIPFGPAADDAFRKAILDLRAKSPDGTAWLSALLEYPAIQPADMRAPTLWLVGTANAGAMASVRQYEGKLAGTKVRLRLLEGLTHAQELEHIDQTLPVALAFTRNATPICRAEEASASADGVQASFEALVAAFNAQDLATAMSLMAEDVTLAYPGRPDGTRQTIEAAFRERWAKGPRARVAAQIEEICQAGDLAVLRIIWKAAYTTPQGAAVTTEERDMETWLREGAHWTLKRGLSFPLRR